MVLLGQKSGDFWAWDAADGELIWRTKVSPGAVDGGFQWNAATDGRLIFASSANSEHHDWQLRNPASDSSVQDSTTGGFWSALDLRTGAILWQTTGSETDPDVNENHSELTVANGLVFAGSYTGYMRALSTSTGQELWRFSTAAVCGDDRCLRSVNSAPTIVGNDLYWGYGYTQVGVGTALGKPQVGDTTDIHLLKFSVPGGDD
jgi:polyvinyl alcohol dehydrogenase (cytochrome)